MYVCLKCLYGSHVGGSAFTMLGPLTSSFTCFLDPADGPLLGVVGANEVCSMYVGPKP